MKLVVGLGNPGRRYGRTRHNAGFRVVERFAERHRIVLDAERFDGRFGRGSAAGVDVGIFEPQTFMNLSGAAVAEALRMLPVADPGEDLVVVFDDVDLPFGRMRLRPGGGAGGHKGMADILARLGRKDVARLRFGVGRGRGPADTSAHVLQRFTPEEEAELPHLLDEAAAALDRVVAGRLDDAMNRVNAPRETATDEAQ